MGHRATITATILSGLVCMTACANPSEDARIFPLLPARYGRLPKQQQAALAHLNPIELDWLVQDGRDVGAPELGTYLRGCGERRRTRLGGAMATVPAIVFLKNTEFGNAPRLNMSLSDGPYHGNPFKAGARILLLRVNPKGVPVVEELLHDPAGMIRDLDVSYDGSRILFSWKKSRKEDDFHLYEMIVADRSVRQITREPGVADIQGRYLPDGRILYHSTRCVSVVDCNESIDVVNLYACNASGGDIVRLTVDQVSTQYPSVLADGRIVYTRWDYNDRGQIYPQGLFTMHPDGTQQRALYGNNSWYPTSLIQARSIPGSTELLAIAAGHHTPPTGKLALVDVSQGREEGRGVKLLAPVRDVRPRHEDCADQDGILYQYPYPLNRDEHIVGGSLFGKKKSRHFAIYWVHRDGQRELLAWDLAKSCRQPLPLVARRKPPVRPVETDATEQRGRFTMEDVYAGVGLPDVPRGTIKRLRVIALKFRPAAVGTSYNRGAAGNARVCTPVSISGAWDTKTVLGDATVHDDGSACFYVPARTPLYFQALDRHGRAVQSMRSWSTLQPGETFSCVGCHDNKNTAPTGPGEPTLAMQAGPQELTPFYAQPRGFSFLKEVQPILDRHCIRCHKGELYSPGYKAEAPSTSFSLLRTPVDGLGSGRNWTESYISLLQAARKGQGRKRVYYAESNNFIHWISPQSGPAVMKPYSFGAARSPMLEMVRRGHNKVALSREELEKLACWIDLAVPFCGEYTEANRWSQKEQAWYRRQVAKQQRLADLERQSLPPVGP
jgi:hypothetical protein